MNRKIALITGVTRLKGIGFAICKKLAAQEMDIFFTYYRPYDKQMPWNVEESEPDQIQQTIQALGVRCEKVELDLSAPDAVFKLFEKATSILGMPSVVVNNATYSTETTIENLTTEELDKHYQVNLRATTLITTEFAKRFDLGSGGRVINLTSGQWLGKMHNEIACHHQGGH